MKFQISNILKQNKYYDFLVWLIDQYRKSRSCSYKPEEFRYLGEGVFIGDDVHINRPERVILKDYVTIANGVVINSKGGLYIGKYSGIGLKSVIWTSEHHYRGAKSIPFDCGADLKPVIIRDFVWMGSHVKITPGTEIGEGAIIGLGAVVIKDVPPLAVVLGNPASIVGYRDKKHFERCKERGAFQCARIGEYQEKMFKMYKRRFNSEIEELGLADL